MERGLGGIPFGGFLIRKAVDELSAELPGLRTFATISPIPGFRTWLDRHDVQTLLRREELRELEPVLAAFAVDSLPRLLTRDWIADTAAVAALQRPLLRLCAVYLLHDAGPAADSVMRFHLSNGARLDRISWLGDRSARGLARSAGMMAHYVYERARLESNHEAFVTRHEIVAADAVKRLVRDRG